jgi:hypothetical protein
MKKGRLETLSWILLPGFLEQNVQVHTDHRPGIDHFCKE